MSDVIAAVRFIRRWQHYVVNDVAAFPLDMAIGLVNQRVAEAVAPPPGVNVLGEMSPPLRQPGNVVRK